MEIFVAFMNRAISKEHTLNRTKLNFSAIIGACMRPTGASKHLKNGVIWALTKEALNRSLHLDDSGGHAIDEKTRRGESIAPIWERY
jgi:hypothetical protein